MSIRSFFARLATKVVAVAVFAWAGSSASAQDIYAAPPGSAAPVIVGGMPGCDTCQHGAARGSCGTCKHGVFAHKNKGPYQVNLCPGACFGYFQTQWRKWDEACPYPYLGQGVSDAPRPPQQVVNVPRPGPGELNPPRPVDPNPKPMDPKKPGGDLPIPPVPGKFNP